MESESVFNQLLESEKEMERNFRELQHLREQVEQARVDAEEDARKMEEMRTTEASKQQAHVEAMGEHMQAKAMFESMQETVKQSRKALETARERKGQAEQFVKQER
ncbi:hypothetical protein CAOG_05452 [Capsaspora owczarzaki ATCC 30864]|uniref:Uncharacterized protein n=1 Tax=Capsaspora owczarzaki (strain ATCC 30864) TaxID=595528 RepID=A0A0D2WTD0_CAPO3|nr:hypothetical protein CAOG_05452 [Capsaspora owczarzaki ATCC 30864]KJE94893.1 hypothetical protein CAOG_005452 [Capsaspora owczarzaki ATCC 30864]|eukprot:XP_004346125.1 hypothetical protein CAOG_05452 [Capsaspora owczarzaki ATCC 30864]